MSLSFVMTKKQIELRDLCCSDAREILAYGGGRAGKTALFVRNIIIRALKEKESRHAIIRQHFVDVRRSVALDTFPKIAKLAFPGLRYTINKSDWFVSLPNKSEIWFAGLDDKERTEKILGMEFSTILFNEISQMSYKSTRMALTRLSQKNALQKKAYYDENPPTKGHWSYKKFIEKIDPQDGVPLENESQAVIQMNPADNLENIAPEYMEMLDSMPEAEKMRFKYGMFADTIAGAIYQKQLNRASLENRIDNNLQRLADVPVCAVMDIGTSDSTAVWIVQFLKDKVLLLDYIEDSFEALPYYLGKIYNDKGYRLTTMFLPHDAKNKNWATGETTREVAERYGQERGFRVVVLPRLAIWDGINAAREMFGKCFFDAKCADGLEALRNYKTQYIDKLGVYSDEPVHDWSSHGADAFRYVALAYSVADIKEQKAKKDITQKQGFSFNDILYRRGIKK